MTEANVNAAYELEVGEEEMIVFFTRLEIQKIFLRFS